MLKFWRHSAHDLMRHLDQEGGFLVVPSAPSLCLAAHDDELWRSHLLADCAVVDSGFLKLLLVARGNFSLPRISGHQLMSAMLEAQPEVVPFRERRCLWVVPSEEEQHRVEALLAHRGFSPALQSYYQAPHYRSADDYRDEALLALAVEEKPDWIVICIGGGKQEKLGSVLRSRLGKRPVILATGGALSFFSGGQARIPKICDRLFLGWLVRILHDPRRFLPRYVSALYLPLALLRLERAAPLAG